MKVLRVSFAIFFFTFLAVVLSCKPKLTDGIYLIPKGYVGEVIILYNQPDGETPNIENGLYVYNIPENGVLKVNVKSIKGTVDHRYFYLNSKGEMERLEYLYPSGREKDKSRYERPSSDNISGEEYESKIFVTAFESGNFGRFNSTSKPISYRSFLVGTPKDRKFLYLNRIERMNSIRNDFNY